MTPRRSRTYGPPDREISPNTPVVPKFQRLTARGTAAEAISEELDSLWSTMETLRSALIRFEERVDAVEKATKATLKGGSRTEDSTPGVSQTSERLVISVADAAARLGVSRAQMYNLVRAGEVNSVKLGKRVLIPLHEIDRLLRGVP